MAELTRDVSDSVILPFDVVDFARFMKAEGQKIIDEHESEMKRNGLAKDIGRSSLTL